MIYYVWRKMEKTKWSGKVTNEEVLKHIGEMRTLINNTQRRKVKWISHILTRNCLFHDAIARHMTKEKGVERRRTQYLDDFRNSRRYWELKEENEDRKTWKRQFIN